MSKILSALFPFYENKKINNKLKKKLSNNEYTSVLENVDNIESVNVEILKEKYEEAISIKEKLEDKAKLNIVGITIAITLIMGASGLLNSIYKKHNNIIIEWGTFILFSFCVIYMLIAGIMAIKVLIDENEIYMVQLKNIVGTIENLKQDYDECISKNQIKNLIRNNSIYTSYECIRNALVCLFILLIFATIPFSIQTSKKTVSFQKENSLNVLYSSSTISDINEYDLEHRIEKVIMAAKNNNKLSDNKMLGMLSSDGKLFIKIKINDENITVLDVEMVEKIIYK